MGKRHTLGMMILIGVVVLLIATKPATGGTSLQASKALIGSIQVDCNNPPLVETTFSWPTDIHRAISQGLCRRPAEILPGNYTNLILTSLDLFEQETWLFATVVMRPVSMPPAYESLLDFDNSLILARRTGEEWQVTFVGTDEFKRLVQEAPSSVISDESRAYFLGIPEEGDISPQGIPASVGLKWPWPNGQEWLYSQGPHSSRALDFYPGSIPEQDRIVVASGEGTVTRKCQDEVQVNLRINHGNDHITGYLHLDKGSASHLDLGSTVKRGVKLGHTYNGSEKLTLPDACKGITGLQYYDDCGCGTNAHLHFYITSGSIYGTVMSGWTLGPNDKCFHKNGYSDICVNDSIKSDNSTEPPPAVSINEPTTNCVSNPVTFSWSSTPSTGGQSRYRIREQSNWSSWTSSTSVIKTLPPNRILTFEVEAKGPGGVGTASHTFQVDNEPPDNPSLVQVDCGAQNNQWQNSCNMAQFIWSGAVDRGCGGIKEYEYRWQKVISPTIQTLQTGTTTSSYFTPSNPVDEGIHKLNLRTQDTLGHWSEWSDIFVFKYDATSPTVSFQINNGAATANQTSVRLYLTANDNVSGVSEVRISHNGINWTDWQPYTEEIGWALPAFNRRTLPVYVQVRDRAGNESTVASDDIYLDLYPPIPHSSNYNLCRNTMDAAGSGNASSSGYQLLSTLGQPPGGGSDTAMSSSFTHRGGFLADITYCPPITVSTVGYTVTDHILASGGALRDSASYRIGDTVGQAVSPNGELISASYQLHSGYWSQMSGAVPAMSGLTVTGLTFQEDSYQASLILLENPEKSLIPERYPSLSSQEATLFASGQANTFSITINRDQEYTSSSSVEIYAQAPNVTHMRLSNSSTYSDDNWMTYQITRTWGLSSSGDETSPRYVYAWFKDEQGNIYGTYFDEIVYDPVGPEGYIEFMGTDVLASTIPLFIQAWDTNSGLSEMRISNESAMTSATWQPYNETLEWPWPDGPVYIQFRDRAGSISTVYNTDLGTDPEPVQQSIYLPLIVK